MVVDSLKETKDFDTIKSGRVGKKTTTHCKTTRTDKESMWLLLFWPPALAMSSIQEDLWDLWEDQPIQSSVQENKKQMGCSAKKNKKQ